MTVKQRIFFTSDTHYGSKNIIKYCNRPYSSVEEMNEAIINNFNSRVTKHDLTYFLGDNVWGHNNYKAFFEQLNGQKIIILGNHDNKQSYKKLLIDNVISGLYDIKHITVDNDFITLCHYPMRSWNRAYHGSYMLYGHVHNTITDYGRSCDVGIDKWNYHPVSWEELKEYFGDIKEITDHTARDDYNIYRNNFERHFTSKYRGRVNDETTILEELLL